jgi:hypothetical protein
MLIPQYAGVGETCPEFNVTVSSGGELTSVSTVYFAFQLQNRIGFNKPFITSAIGYSAGQKITITIPASVRQPGWDIHGFVISVSASNDPNSFIRITRVPGYQTGDGIEPQSVLTALPATIVLSKDSHITPAPNVPNLVGLPTGNNLLNGAIRWVTDKAIFLEYRQDSVAEPNETSVFEAPDGGNWHRTGTAGIPVEDTTQGNGCNREIDIIAINDTLIKTPPYDANSPSGNKILPGWGITYWLINDYEEDIGSPLPAGIRFGMSLELEGQKSPDLLAGLFMIEFLGYVRYSDGSLKTTYTSDDSPFPLVGGMIPYVQRKSNLATPEQLPPGWAIAIRIRPYFHVAELNNLAPPGAQFTGYPFIYPQSGDYNPIGKLLPDGIVFALGDNYRVVAGTGLSVDILPGIALMPDSYDFPMQPRRNIAGLEEDTEGQQIIVNGNGAALLKPASYQKTDSEAIRAIIGTKIGTSAVGDWSAYKPVPTEKAMTVTLNYPCDSQGRGTIRDNYPDVIAGNKKGAFNPSSVTIYVQRQSTGQIRAYSGIGVLAAPTQVANATNWLDGVVVTTIPVNTDSSFSLYAPKSADFEATEDGGDFPTDSYRVCYKFEYNGTRVTSISHASPPCIAEWDGSFSDILSIIKSWGIALSPLQSPRSITENQTFDFQTRRYGNDYIVYEPASTVSDNSVSVWKPTWLGEGRAGRWILDSVREFVATITTNSLTVGAEQQLLIPLNVRCKIYRVTVSKPARVRLYQSLAYRAADIGRPLGSQPPFGKGLITELEFSPQNLAIDLSPFAEVFNLESSKDIATLISNLTNQNTQITVTFYCIK